MLNPELGDAALEAAPALAIPAPTFALIRASQSARRLDGWALALTSKGIAGFVRWEEDVGVLYVASDDAEMAVAELDAIDDEEREAQRARVAAAAVVPRRVSKHASFGAAALALLLLGFFGVTGPRAGSSLWFSAGASDAERVLHGEWWRAATALTLHADGAHVISNVAIGTLVVGAVMRSEGVGWGSALVLASGVAGNLLNAWVHQSLHSSVGFSTAVFGAIGILGGLAFVRSLRRAESRRLAWTSLAGALALLALLGTSEKPQVDMLAHLFGALAGVGFGVVAAWRSEQIRSTVSQWFAGLGTAAAVLGTWWIALS